MRVKPRAKVSALSQEPDGTWIARLKSAPVEGKANDELIALVAEHFHCRRSDVVIKAGAMGRTKLIAVNAS